MHGHHDKEMIKDPPEHFNRRTLIVTKGGRSRKSQLQCWLTLFVGFAACSGTWAFHCTTPSIREPCRFHLTLCILNVKVLDLIIFWLLLQILKGGNSILVRWPKGQPWLGTWHLWTQRWRTEIKLRCSQEVCGYLWKFCELWKKSMAWKGPTGPTGPTPPILPASKPVHLVAGRKQLPQASPRSSVPWRVGRGFPRCCDEHSCYTSRSARNTPGVCTCRASTNGWALLDVFLGSGIGIWYDLVWFGQRPDWGTVCASSRRDSSLVAVEGLITHFHWLEEFRRENTTPMIPMPKRTFQCFCFFLERFFF